MAFFSSSTWALTACAVGLLYIGYRSMLCRPIPGIPHNKDSAYTLLGDVPRMLAKVKSGDILFPWIFDETVRQNSPIVQFFGRPFGKPWVVVADSRESQDILLRRTKEFDRADFFGDLFIGLTPDFHVHFRSDDERTKKHKNLLKDLMTPAFLHQVAAPQVYASFAHLIEVWSIKARLAQEHPIDIHDDIFNAILDSITSITFGLDIQSGVMVRQIEQLRMSTKPSIPEDINEPVKFNRADRPSSYQAMITLIESVGHCVKSPIPRLTHTFIRCLPYYRRAHRTKENLIVSELDKSVTRCEEGNLTERCAIDNVVQRESNAAKKENRPPNYKTRAVIDELFGFLVGGHDTSSHTILWGLKHIFHYPEAQNTLRKSLLEGYERAAAEQRAPTLDEIIKTNIPYLDATIEEMNRTAVLFPGAVRVAVEDTTILGHAIPKGTDVFLAQTGPDFFSAPIPVPEHLRSESSRAVKHPVGQWDPSDMKQFKPERWLKTDEKGDEYYDAMAGPHLAFGLGPRGCYGRRLAYLQLKIMLVLIIWNFELLDVQGEIGSFKAGENMGKVSLYDYLRLRRIEL